MQGQQKILILGGTSFMGKQLVQTLTAHNPSTQIHLLNRGKKYWNNEVYKDRPNVHFFYGDRNEHKEMGKAIEYLNEKVGISGERPWTAVVDFTSYKWRDVQSVARGLRGKTQLYIFISTDSIYNNSPHNDLPISQQSHPIEQMYKQQKGTKIADKYGYDKLKCELYLARRKPVPYVNLRLPDVLGPYENTNRYWCLMKWIQESGRYPLELNQKDKVAKLSFVYSKDIAKLVMRLIDTREQVKKYTAYNLAFNQLITYQQLIQLISKSLHPPITPSYSNTKKSQSSGLFPSTDYTHLDCELAIKELNWSPSSLELGIRETTQFFELAAQLYPVELKDMNREFRRKVVDRD